MICYKGPSTNLKQLVERVSGQFQKQSEKTPKNIRANNLTGSQVTSNRYSPINNQAPQNAISLFGNPGQQSGQVVVSKHDESVQIQEAVVSVHGDYKLNYSSNKFDQRASQMSYEEKRQLHLRRQYSVRIKRQMTVEFPEIMREQQTLVSLTQKLQLAAVARKNMRS